MKAPGTGFGRGFGPFDPHFIPEPEGHPSGSLQQPPELSMTELEHAQVQTD